MKTLFYLLACIAPLFGAAAQKNNPDAARYRESIISELGASPSVDDLKQFLDKNKITYTITSRSDEDFRIEVRPLREEDRVKVESVIQWSRDEGKIHFVASAYIDRNHIVSTICINAMYGK